MIKVFKKLFNKKQKPFVCKYNGIIVEGYSFKQVRELMIFSLTMDESFNETIKDNFEFQIQNRKTGEITTAICSREELEEEYKKIIF